MSDPIAEKWERLADALEKVNERDQRIAELEAERDDLKAHLTEERLTTLAAFAKMEAERDEARAALEKSVNLTCNCANDLGHASWCKMPTRRAEAERDEALEKLAETESYRAANQARAERAEAELAKARMDIDSLERIIVHARDVPMFNGNPD